MKALLLLLFLGAGQSAQLDEQLRAEIRAKRYLAAEKLLSNPDVDPDSRDKDGWTALMYAVRTDDPDLVKLLLKASVDLEIQNREGESALVVAARRGNVEGARQLLMAGANVAAKDARGRTALDWAEAEGRTYLSQIIRIASRPSISKVTIAERPVDVGTGPLVPPRVVKETPPLYTKGAFDRGIEGRVVLKVIIRKDGSIGPVRIDQSLDKELDEAASEAIRRWQFNPATVNGEPINALANIEVDFIIQKQPKKS